MDAGSTSRRKWRMNCISFLFNMTRSPGLFAMDDADVPHGAETTPKNRI